MTKRAVPILILAIFALSILPILPVHAAISIDDVTGVLVDHPEEGDYGDTVVVEGSGVTAGMTVNLYWDAVKAWDGEKGLLNTTEADPDGTYEVWFDVPEAIYGKHWLWVKDTDTSATAMYEFPFKVIARLKLSPSSGLPDDKITIYGYGFSEEVEIITIKFHGEDLTTSPRIPDTNELGSWTATFKVPDKDYGDYQVYAEDEKGVSAKVDFTVGASITLNPESGPVGTVVEVRGRGFDPPQTIDDGEVEITDGTTYIACYIFDTPVDVEGDGDIKLKIVIPQVDDMEDFDTIKVTDGKYTADADFEVTGLAEIEVDPEYGIQGARIRIYGYNFTAISGKEVSVELWDVDLSAKVTDIDTFDTNSDGEFSGRFYIPAVASLTYAIRAIQADYYIDADTTFKIGLMIVIVSPSKGPTGIRATITGTGFTGKKTWNATLGDIAIFEDMSVEDDGTLSDFFYVPTVDVGTYTVTLMDIYTEIEVTTEFEVTYTTTAALDPASAPNEYNVTIEGWYFAAKDGGDLDFVLYNATDKEEMKVKQGKDPGVDAVTDEDGNFTAWWEVPDSDTLSLGDYTINVTDSEDLFMQISFSVVSKEVSISSRKTTFVIGDSVSFNIESSFKQTNSYIKILDPADNLYWRTDDLIDDIWVKVGTTQVAPYYSQTARGNPMVLLDDAPLGTWSWTWYDEDGDKLDSGTFIVSAAPVIVIEERITDLETAIGELSGDLTDMSGDLTDMSGDLTDLGTTVTGLEDAIEDVATEVGDAVDEAVTEAMEGVDTKIGDLDDKISGVETKVGETDTKVGGLSTLVYGAIGASLVAALAAIVSLMQISRRIAG